MKSTDERWQHMGSFKIKIIIWTVEIRGHSRYEVGIVLFIVISAKLNSSNLCDSIRFVRRFKKTGEQMLFLHRLWSKFRINAGGSEIEQFFNLEFMSSIDYVGRDHNIVIYELCFICTVFKYPTNLGSGKKDIFRLFRGKESFNVGLSSQVKFGACPCHEIRVPLFLQFSHKRGANKPAMTGDVNFGISFHFISRLDLGLG